MKTMLMPREASWWTWLFTVALLASGLAGNAAAFIAAIALSLLQTLVFVVREKSLVNFPVQIRTAYTALLVLCFLPTMRWLYWLPTLGTIALLLFGYCLMARLLSLTPWNRREPLSPGLIRRTLFSPPVGGNLAHGLPSCRCRAEAQAGKMEVGNVGRSVDRLSP